MAKSDEVVLGYIYRRAAEDGWLQEPITVIAAATGYSTATVWRALGRLEKNGAIKIQRTSNPTESQRIFPMRQASQNTNAFDHWITQSEELVKLAQEILKGFLELREQHDALQARLDAYQSVERRVLSSMPFGKGYEIVVRRTQDAETNGNEVNGAIALARALSFNHQASIDTEQGNGQ